MKKILFLSILTTFVCLSFLESCKKNSNIESTSIETVDTNSDLAEIEEIETDAILADDNEYQSDANTKMTAIGQNIVVATEAEDGGNDCQTFKYAGYSKVSAEAGDWGFDLTLSQTDTIDSVYTNKPLLVTTGTLTRQSPTTYRVNVYQTSWDTMKTATIQFIAKMRNGKIVKAKGVKCIGQTTNEALYGTSVWGSEYNVSYTCGITAQQRLNNTGWLTLDTSYIPQKSDIILFKKGSVYKAGVITSVPIVTPPKPATTTKPAVSAKYKFRISEMNNKDCKSTKTNKTKAILKSDFPIGITSIDESYTAYQYKRFNL